MKKIFSILIFSIAYVSTWGDEPKQDRYYTFEACGDNHFMNIFFSRDFDVVSCRKDFYEEGLMFGCLIDFCNTSVKPGLFYTISGFCFSPPKSNLPIGTKNTRHFSYKTSQGIRCEAVIVYEKGLYNRTDYFPKERTAVTLDSIPIKYVPQAELLFNSILFDDKKPKGNKINGIKRFDFETTK